MSIKRFRLFLGLTLAVVAVATTVNFALAAQNSSNTGDSYHEYQATAAGTMAAAASTGSFAQCMAPTATPGATQAAAAPTAVATEAAAPATMAATAAMAATMAPTKPATKAPAPTKTPSPLPPTAIPKGKKPATAGVVITVNATMVRASGKCLQVLSATAGGPAAVAGIKSGDFILGIDAVETVDLPTFYAEVNKHVSGDTVSVTIQRGTDVSAVKVVLGLNPYAK